MQSVADTLALASLLFFERLTKGRGWPNYVLDWPLK